MVMGSSSTFGVNPSFMRDLPYDAVNDFEPVSFVSYAPNVLVVTAQLPVATVGQLVALATERPGELTFASSGTGGSPHLRSAEHTSELQSLMRISYAVFCLIKKNDKLYHT